MRDSTEAKRCTDCGTEYYLTYGYRQGLCRECEIADTNDPDTPTEDGDPCIHCQHPIWYCNSEEQYFHVDPDKVCFLASGKSPVRLNTKTPESK